MGEGTESKVGKNKTVKTEAERERGLNFPLSGVIAELVLEKAEKEWLTYVPPQEEGKGREA